MKRVFLILSFVACLFMGCTSENESGTISVSLAQSKAISADLEPSYHIVSFRSEDGKTLSDVRLTNDVPTAEVVADMGIWHVEATAYNKSDVAIGSGENTVNVYPGRKSNCPITIVENDGNGSLNVTVDNPEGLAYKANLYTHANWSERLDPTTHEVTRDPETGKYSVMFNDLPRGYYQFELVNPANESLYSTSVRIAANQVLDFTCKLKGDGSFDIEIGNGIVPVPEIVLSGLQESYHPDSMFEVHASAEGYKNAVYTWQINGKDFGYNPGSSMNFRTDSHFHEGVNILKCTMVADSVVWDKEFIVRVIDPARPDSISVEGDVKFVLDQDVLLPRELTVRLDIGANKYQVRGFDPIISYGYIAPDVVTKATVEAPFDKDYTAYLKSEVTSQGTLVHVVVDSYIENPAYIKVTHDYDFELDDTESIGLYVEPTDERINRGILVGHDKSPKTIKVKAGSYHSHGQWTSGLVNFVQSKFSANTFDIAAGETKEYTISTDYNAGVRFTLPAGVNAADLMLDQGKGGFHTFLSVKDGVNYFEPETRDFFMLDRNVPFKAYEQKNVELLPNTVADVTLTERVVQPVNSGITVPAGTVKLNVSQHVLVNAHAYFEFKIGENREVLPFIGIQSREFTVDADAPLEYYIWNIDPEIKVTVTLSEDGKTINMDIDKEILEPAFIQIDAVVADSVPANASYYIYDRNTNGGIVCSPATGSNTLKVVPGSYDFSGRGGWNVAVDHSASNVTFEAKAGETHIINWTSSYTPEV